MAKQNNISKQEALDFSRTIHNKNKMIENIVAVTFYGSEYTEMYDDHFAMSKLCRAFNISEQGKSNRLKNRYKKYLEVEGAEEYMKKILAENYPGFLRETPRMDDLLARFAEESKLEKSRPVQKATVAPQPDYDTSYENRYQYENQYQYQESSSTTPQKYSTNSEEQEFPVEAIPVVLLLIGIFIFIKWNPILFFLLIGIAAVVIVQIKKGRRLRERGEVSNVRRIVLGALGVFFAFIVIVGIKSALVDDGESLIMIIVYGILAALCFKGAAG